LKVDGCKVLITERIPKLIGFRIAGRPLRYLPSRIFPMMSGSQPQKSKADRIDGLLSFCAFLAVFTAVFQLAEGHYLRAVMAGVLLLVVVPWLGKRWINRNG
jgi:hypothetical protein